MKTKSGFTKIKIVLLLACVLLVIVGLIFLYLRTDYNRRIKVNEYSGVVNVEKNGKSKKIDNQTVLQNKDVIVTGDASYVVFDIDDKMRSFVAENSNISVDISGNTNDSNTKFNIKGGAVFSEIPEGLSDKSAFEIRTPNSLVSSKSGSFRVSFYEKDDISYTRISVLDGSVSSLAISPEGNVGENIIVTENGRESLIYTDNSTGLCGFAYFDEEGNYTFNENSVSSKVINIDSYPVSFHKYLLSRSTSGVRFSGLATKDIGALARLSGENSEENMFIDGNYIALVMDVLNIDDTDSSNELATDETTDSGVEEVIDNSEPVPPAPAPSDAAVMIPQGGSNGSVSNRNPGNAAHSGNANKKEPNVSNTPSKTPEGEASGNGANNSTNPNDMVFAPGILDDGSYAEVNKSPNASPVTDAGSNNTSNPSPNGESGGEPQNNRVPDSNVEFIGNSIYWVEIPE